MLSDAAIASLATVATFAINGLTVLGGMYIYFRNRETPEQRRERYRADYAAFEARKAFFNEDPDREGC